MKKLTLLLAAGFTLAAASSASAWDGHDGWHRDRWHGRRHAYTVIGFSYYGRPYHWPYYSHRPVEVIQVVPAATDTVVINVPNSNGSYSPVTLRRVGGVYIGPRGEQYLNLPTVEQLQGVYGLE